MTRRLILLAHGDLGFGENGEKSADYINMLASSNAFVYHIGDVSYADDDFLVPSQALGFFYKKVYNKWMNSMSPIMSKIPYMVCAGNHEAECHSPTCLVSRFKKDHLCNITAYNARFKMPSVEPKGTQNMWYSFKYGPIHFTSISSETDYPGAPSNAYTLTRKNGNFGDQLAWLEANLQKAAANRANVPWLIVGMHRPLYLRHEQAYEQHYPIANSTAVKDGVSIDAKTYTNPKAPVYVVTGGPGNPEANHLSGKNNLIPWNVLESMEYGINTVRVTRNSLSIKYATSVKSPIKMRLCCQYKESSAHCVSSQFLCTRDTSQQVIDVFVITTIQEATH